MQEDQKDDLKVVCDDCQSAALSETLREEMLLVLENKLGLAVLHREALESFIETIFTDLQKTPRCKTWTIGSSVWRSRPTVSG